MADCEHSKTFLASWHGSWKYKKLVSKIKLAPLWKTTVPISSGHSLWYQLLLIASSRVINVSRSALEILEKKEKYCDVWNLKKNGGQKVGF